MVDLPELHLTQYKLSLASPSKRRRYTSYFEITAFVLLTEPLVWAMDAFGGKTILSPPRWSINGVHRLNSKEASANIVIFAPQVLCRFFGQ